MEETKAITFMARLEKHPHIKERFEALLSLIENESEDCKTADQIEEKLVKEVQLLGNLWLKDWAEHQEHKQQEAAWVKDFTAKKHGKKKLHGRQLLAK